MMTFEETMAFGADQYSDVLEALDHAGLPSMFTQTGGMNAAIEVQLETGQTLLVTDAEDSLAWVRAEHDGWAVGLYGPGERDEGPLAFGQTEDGNLPALLDLVGDVMFRRGGTDVRTTP